MIVTTHLCVVLRLNISETIPLLPVYAFITSALPTTTTTTNSNYRVSMHKCLCLLVILMTTPSLVFKKSSIFLAIICYKSRLTISSCTIILFTCSFTQNTIIVVSYHYNKDYSQSLYIFKFYHSGFFLLFIAQLQKCL